MIAALRAAEARITGAFRKTSGARVLTAIWAGLLIGSLGAHLVKNGWIVDDQGRPIPADFLAIWTGGRLVLSGHGHDVYDWLLIYKAEIQEIGHFVRERTYFLYPPLFFLIAVPLALLPYAVAFLGFAAATLLALAAGVRRIVGSTKGILVACGTPAVVVNFAVAHNGALTAALMAAFLATLEKQPIVSGIFLGLLTYKPQFGILIPLALIAGRHWRTLAAATAVTALWVVLWFTIDPAIFPLFFHSLLQTSQQILTEGKAGWNKLQSAYGLMRAFGAGNAVAWSAQGCMILACAFGVIRTWRSHAPFPLKAAALVMAALLSTPYVYIYDLVLLSVALAYLYRHAPLSRSEGLVVACANLAIVAYTITGAPVGVVGLLAVAFAIVHRIPGRAPIAPSGHSVAAPILEGGRLTPCKSE